MEFEENGGMPMEPQSGEQNAAAESSMANSDFALVETPDDEGAPDTGAETGSEGEGEQEPAAASDMSVAGETQQKQQKPRQTPEENHAFRAMRLKAHREAMQAAEAAMSAKTDDAIANSGVINPYTKQPFQSMKELLEYGERYRKAEIAKQARQTGRSVSELEEDAANRAFISNMRRSAEQQSAATRQAQAAAQVQREFIENDVLDFVEKFPQFGVDEVAALESNPAFRRFCGSRFGREPLASLYEDYRNIVGDAGASAVARASSRSTRSTASGTAGGVALTPSQKKALDEWNTNNPEMKMTAKEFLGR